MSLPVRSGRPFKPPTPVPSATCSWWAWRLTSLQAGWTQGEYRLLPILCGTVARPVGFLFANKSATISVPVLSLALEVINAAGRLEPDDGIFRAVLLCLLFGPIASETACRLARRTACRSACLPIGQCGTSAKKGKEESENERRPWKLSYNVTPHMESLLRGIFPELNPNQYEKAGCADSATNRTNTCRPRSRAVRGLYDKESPALLVLIEKGQGTSAYQSQAQRDRPARLLTGFAYHPVEDMGLALWRSAATFTRLSLYNASSTRMDCRNGRAR
jgi:hypothetical protein